MINFKKFPLLSLFVLLFFNACTQNKSEVKKTNQSEKFISNTPDPKSYNSHPEYRLSYYSSNCRFEIRLNDMLVFMGEMSHTNSGSVGSNSLWLNYNILHSGKQKLTIRIYPVDVASTLGEYATSRLMGLDFYPDKSKSPETYERLFKYELPEKDIKDLPFIEYEKEFKATVPYNLVR